MSGARSAAASPACRFVEGDVAQVDKEAKHAAERDGVDEGRDAVGGEDDEGSEKDGEQLAEGEGEGDERDLPRLQAVRHPISQVMSQSGRRQTRAFRACIAAAVPSLRTWYVRERSGGGIASPPSANRLVIRRTSHVVTRKALSPGGIGERSSTSASDTPPTTSKLFARASRLTIFFDPLIMIADMAKSAREMEPRFSCPLCMSWSFPPPATSARIAPAPNSECSELDNLLVLREPSDDLHAEHVFGKLAGASALPFASKEENELTSTPSRSCTPRRMRSSICSGTVLCRCDCEPELGEAATTRGVSPPLLSSEFSFRL